MLLPRVTMRIAQFQVSIFNFSTSLARRFIHRFIRRSLGEGGRRIRVGGSFQAKPARTLAL
jgi:hypothetical protein